MKICTTIEDLQNALSHHRTEKRTVGFVPTMGALHGGHLSLIAASKLENDVTVCSIFINHTQFNNPTDLEKYPRTIEEDRQLLIGARCDILFVPPVEEMYKNGDYTTISDDFGRLSSVMEGKSRPSHFAGMLTIVNKLFTAVKPDNAYFGKKDFQQLALIIQFVKKHDIPVAIKACPIVREADGLAMSSRNRLLSAEERKKAALIPETLHKVKSLWGKMQVAEIKKVVDEIFAKDSIMKLDYFNIASAETLADINDASSNNEPAMAFIAVQCGKVRLIDNISLAE